MAYKRVSPQPVVEGGTGIQSATVYAPICGGTTTTGAFQSAATGQSTSGYILTSNGTGALPSWKPNSGSSVGGTLSFLYTQGGSNFTVTQANGYYYGGSAVMTSVIDNTSGAFFPGTGGGTGTGNAASFTAPASGLYSFTMSVALNGPVSGGNEIIIVVVGSSDSGYILDGNLNNLVSTGVTSPTLSGTVNIIMNSSDVAYFLLGVGAGGSASIGGIAGTSTFVSGFRIA